MEPTNWCLQHAAITTYEKSDVGVQQQTNTRRQTNKKTKKHKQKNRQKFEKIMFTVWTLPIDQN